MFIQNILAKPADSEANAPQVFDADCTKPLHKEKTYKHEPARGRSKKKLPKASKLSGVSSG